MQDRKTFKKRKLATSKVLKFRQCFWKTFCNWTSAYRHYRNWGWIQRLSPFFAPFENLNLSNLPLKLEKMFIRPFLELRWIWPNDGTNQDGSSGDNCVWGLRKLRKNQHCSCLWKFGLIMFQLMTVELWNWSQKTSRRQKISPLGR